MAPPSAARTALSVRNWRTRASARGAESELRGGFLEARCGARHQKAGDIGASHHKNEHDKSAEKRRNGNESRFHAAAHFCADDGDVVFVAFGMFAFKGGHDDVSSAWACATVTPGLRRPIMLKAR